MRQIVGWEDEQMPKRLIATYVGMSGNRHVVATETKMIMLPASYKLNWLMGAASHGDAVMIVYKGTRRIGRGWYANCRYHDYEVYVEWR